MKTKNFPGKVNARRISALGRMSDKSSAEAEHLKTRITLDPRSIRTKQRRTSVVR